MGIMFIVIFMEGGGVVEKSLVTTPIMETETQLNTK
jgi:hypothetical protein